jgi:hypothetical protein
MARFSVILIQVIGCKARSKYGFTLLLHGAKEQNKCISLKFKNGLIALCSFVFFPLLYCVTIPQFSLDQGSTKDEVSTKENSP